MAYPAFEQIFSHVAAAAEGRSLEVVDVRTIAPSTTKWWQLQFAKQAGPWLLPRHRVSSPSFLRSSPGSRSADSTTLLFPSYVSQDLMFPILLPNSSTTTLPRFDV